MKDDTIFSLSEYKNYLLENDYEDDIAVKVVNLKIKHSVLGIIGRDDKPASTKKMVVRDLLEHLNKCMHI